MIKAVRVKRTAQLVEKSVFGQSSCDKCSKIGRVRKMLERGKNERVVIEMVDTESLVPPGHLLRQVDAAVDFEKLYEIVELLYSEEEGRRRKKAAKKQKTVTVSTTDPKCGVFHKGEHKRCFAYEANNR